MTLPLQFYYLNYNPANPIPNGPFVSPENFYIQGPYSPLVVGSGLSVDLATGAISAGPTSGASGTFTAQSGEVVTVTNGIITSIV